MSRLVWTGETGISQHGTSQALRLGGRPIIEGVPFSKIDWMDGVGHTFYDEQWNPITEEQNALIEAWLQQHAVIDAESKVHGVDNQGVYLGLVIESAAFYAVAKPPPNDGFDYRWNFTSNQWVKVMNLDQAKEMVKTKIKSIRGKKLEKTPFAGRLIQTDLGSKQQIDFISRLPALPPTALKWRTADNNYLDMTPALYQQLAGTIALREGQLFAKSSALQDSVDAKTTVEEVLATDIESGWPT